MKKKSILTIILILMTLSGGSIGYYYWYQGSHYVKSEDSRVTGDIYRVMPTNCRENNKFRSERRRFGSS